MVNSHLGVEKRPAGTGCLALEAAHRTIVRRKGKIICKTAEENFWGWVARGGGVGIRDLGTGKAGRESASPGVSGRCALGGEIM